MKHCTRNLVLMGRGFDSKTQPDKETGPLKHPGENSLTFSVRLY